jgi:hypothetical protein
LGDPYFILEVGIGFGQVSNALSKNSFLENPMNIFVWLTDFLCFDALPITYFHSIYFRGKLFIFISNVYSIVFCHLLKVESHKL